MSTEDTSTSQRAAKVDDPDALKEIIQLIAKLPGQACWAMHYRTQKVLKESKIDLPGNLTWTEPVGCSDFLTLLSNCTAVISPSGGVQEDACILGVRCATIRDRTERPETVYVGGECFGTPGTADGVFKDWTLEGSDEACAGSAYFLQMELESG
jgi:UDP-N-acetylglucosamine 2-epimerase